MVTPCIIIANLDSLILDYLNRRYESVGKNFKEESGASLPDLEPYTLEEIYTTFLAGNKNARGVSAELGVRAIYKQPAEERLKVLENSSSVVQISEAPKLPSEVILYLLNFCSVKDKFRMRNLNKTWLQCASDSLRNSSTRSPLHFADESQIHRFLTTFENGGIGDGSFPFHSFSLCPDKMDVTPFLMKMGPQIRNCNFKFSAPLTPFALLWELSQETPNLKSLHIHGHVRLNCPWLLKSANFSSLRSLTLSPGSSSGMMSVETLRSWILSVPQLNELKCNHHLELYSESNWMEFLDSTNNLTSVHAANVHLTHRKPIRLLPYQNALEMECYNGSRKLKMLVYEDVPTRNKISSFILFLSKSVRTLKFKLSTKGSGSRLPQLLLLERLEMTMGSGVGVVLEPIRPELLPVLKHVTLRKSWWHIGGRNEMTTPFKHEIFTTVRSLSLIDMFAGRQDLESQPWCGIFPNITTLRSHGAMERGHFDGIVTNFPYLAHLHLSGFSDSMRNPANLSTGPHWSIFNVYRRKETEKGTTSPILVCPLSRLQNLKILEFEESRWVTELVADLVHLTLSKALQPLENLNVFTTTTNKNADRDFALFMSIATMNWHGNVKFQVQEKSNYTDW